MKLVTWNIQWCRGVDGRVDPARVARTARELADFDVLCLQEVAINFPRLGGSRGEDQMAALAASLPGYQGHFGAATDVDDGHGGRSLFGNAIFTRLPAVQTYRHLLPWPADPDVPSMQRLALEVVVESTLGPIRVVSTHLEYYSATQRMAQVEALRAIHAQACGHAHAPRRSGDPGEPFEARVRPAAALVCGDFNFRPDAAEHARMTEAIAGGVPAFVDAWCHLHTAEEHPPSWGVHDTSHPLICCDFVFASEDLCPRLRAISIDGHTEASDHQPVIVTLS